MTAKSGPSWREGCCMEQPELFRYTIDLLERLQITYFVVGSLASMAYGEPRSTLDNWILSTNGRPCWNA
jgi:hypothetical protein